MIHAPVTVAAAREVDREERHHERTEAIDERPAEEDPDRAGKGAEVFAESGHIGVKQWSGGPPPPPTSYVPRAQRFQSRRPGAAPAPPEPLPPHHAVHPAEPLLVLSPLRAAAFF